MRRHLRVGSRLLVAVSGGADSVALLHALRASPFALVVGHVDHGLRRGSRRDARFVTDLARRWDLPCRVARVDVRGRMRRAGETLEEAARTLRYHALLSMARRMRCDAIVTAHTAEDQAETVFMNVLRGAGPRGLAGMPAVRPLTPRTRILLVRPLLTVHRRDLRNYLRRQKLSWREDPTNGSTVMTRNYLRLRVLPVLEKRFPGLHRRLVHMASLFREESGGGHRVHNRRSFPVS